MTVRVGVSISEREVSAVLVRDGKIIWAGSRLVDEVDADSALDTLIASAPIRRWPKPGVHVAVGPAQSQLRKLHGLPPIEAPALERVIRESAGRFFLKNGIPIATSSVRRDADGDCWAGAVDEPMMRRVETTCERYQLRVERFLPSVAALGHAPHEDVLSLRDGDSRIEATYDGARLTGVRRMADSETVGDDSGVGMDQAYGAAVAPRGEISVTRRRRTSSRQLLLGIAFAISGCVAATAAPWIAANRTSENAARELNVLAPRRSAVTRMVAELAALSAASAAIESRRAPSALTDLATITSALPEDAALGSYTSDSLSITLIVVGSSVSTVIPALDSLVAFESPELLGAVGRTQTGTEELERGTIRLRRSKRSI